MGEGLKATWGPVLHSPPSTRGMEGSAQPRPAAPTPIPVPGGDGCWGGTAGPWGASGPPPTQRHPEQRSHTGGLGGGGGTVRTEKDSMQTGGGKWGGFRKFLLSRNPDKSKLIQTIWSECNRPTLHATQPQLSCQQSQLRPGSLLSPRALLGPENSTVKKTREVDYSHD